MNEDEAESFTRSKIRQDGMSMAEENDLPRDECIIVAERGVKTDFAMHDRLFQRRACVCGQDEGTEYAATKRVKDSPVFWKLILRNLQRCKASQKAGTRKQLRVERNHRESQI